MVERILVVELVTRRWVVRRARGATDIDAVGIAGCCNQPCSAEIIVGWCRRRGADHQGQRAGLVVALVAFGDLAAGVNKRTDLVAAGG
jgi:hypothetical protein